MTLSLSSLRHQLAHWDDVRERWCSGVYTLHLVSMSKRSSAWLWIKCGTHEPNRGFHIPFHPQLVSAAVAVLVSKVRMLDWDSPSMCSCQPGQGQWYRQWPARFPCITVVNSVFYVGHWVLSVYHIVMMQGSQDLSLLLSVLLMAVSSLLLVSDLSLCVSVLWEELCDFRTVKSDVWDAKGRVLPYITTLPPPAVWSCSHILLPHLSSWSLPL